MAAVFSTRHFQEAHMKRPRGVKPWMFEIGNRVVQAPPMKFMEAKKWVKQNHVERGEIVTVNLLP